MGSIYFYEWNIYNYGCSYCCNNGYFNNVKNVKERKYINSTRNIPRRGSSLF